MIKAVTKEFKSLALIDRLKLLMHVESCYSKIVKLLNRLFPLSSTPPKNRLKLLHAEISITKILFL